MSLRPCLPYSTPRKRQNDNLRQSLRSNDDWNVLVPDSTKLSNRALLTDPHSMRYKESMLTIGSIILVAAGVWCVALTIGSWMSRELRGDHDLSRHHDWEE